MGSSGNGLPAGRTTVPEGILRNWSGSVPGNARLPFGRIHCVAENRDFCRVMQGRFGTGKRKGILT